MYLHRGQEQESKWIIVGRMRVRPVLAAFHVWPRAWGLFGIEASTRSRQEMNCSKHWPGMWSIFGVLTKLITHGVFIGLCRVWSLREWSRRRGFQAKGMNKLIVASDLEILICCTRGGGGGAFTPPVAEHLYRVFLNHLVLHIVPVTGSPLPSSSSARISYYNSICFSEAGGGSSITKIDPLKFSPGLSYRASGGLLAGVPGKRAGGLVHYALYEPGGVL
jgi:hypothetical protein